MKKLLLTALISGLLFNSAYADEWLELDHSAEFKYYINVNSINRNSNVVSAWFKSVLFEPKQVWGVTISHYLSHAYYNCSQKNTAEDMKISYKPDGMPGRSVSKQYLDWELVIPGSIGETSLIYLCQ